MELKYFGKPVAFLAKMIGYRPLAVQLVGNGLLDPNRMKMLLDSSCPREVTLDVLMIISDLARMDKVRYCCCEIPLVGSNKRIDLCLFILLFKLVSNWCMLQ